ncbi:glycerophosphodiester phosphodiesterase [Yoonia sp. MH D7]
MQHELMKIIAHRGDSANHPENTPKSWSKAYATGAHAVEADVRFLTDETGICAHDPTLERLFNRPERVDVLTLPELQSLTGGQAGLGLLTGVLDNAKAGRAVVLDLKDESPRALDLVWNNINERVSTHHRHLVTIGCHSTEAVAFFEDKQSVNVLGFIPSADDGPSFCNRGATIIRLWESDVTPRRVQDIKSLGCEVWVTTGAGTTGRRTGEINEMSLRLLSAAQIDGILVNDVPQTKLILEEFK